MGLAASQARFLAITSRKMNCEFQSMQIAQQKLSVTRDLQKASEDYQASLNATKLIWDTTDDLGIFDVSYDVMMSPSVLNEFDPFLITDLNGKILLTEPMFNAALAAGIIDENGDPTGKLFEGGKPFVDPSIKDDPNTTDNEELVEQTRANDAKIDGSRNAFLYQLGQVNLIEGAMAQKIMSQGIYTKSGIGGPIYDKSISNALSTNAFINYMKNKTYESIKEDVQYKVTADKKYDFDIVYSKDVGANKAGDIICARGDSFSGEDKKVRVKEYNSGDRADTTFIYTAPPNTIATVEYTDINNNTYPVKTDIGGKQFKILAGAPIPFNGIRVGFEITDDVHQKGDFIYGLNFKELLSDSSNNSLLSSSAVTLKDASNEGKFVLTRNGAVISDSIAEKLTLGDILTGKYELGYHSSSTQDYKAAFTKVLEAMANVLGMDAGSTAKGLNVDAASDTALDQAFEFTKSLFNSLYTDNTSSDPSNLRKDAEIRDCVVKGSNDIYSISLTNMLKAYLTNFAIALEGFGSPYNVSKGLTKDSRFVTDDLNYNFLISNDAAMTDIIMLNSDFYNMLYNQIATCGACTDKTKQQMVTDNEWLQQQLKRGSLFISSLNNDGYYYQGAYTLNGHVQEVKDENAIARAELEYSVQKSKLNTKEESLELQMKNLDMEISSLTTEYDTVKNLISKGIEKVFTMFST